MAKIKLQIEFKDKNGDEFKQILGYINPNCNKEQLDKFVTDLNGLTSNKVVEVFKVVEKFLSEVAPDDEISVADLLEILQGSYQPVDDEFTDAEINSVLQGSYQPVDDEFSDSDFIFKE